MIQNIVATIVCLVFVGVSLYRGLKLKPFDYRLATGALILPVALIALIWWP